MRSPEVILSEIRVLHEELAQALAAPATARVKVKRRPMAAPPELTPSKDAMDKVRRSLRKNGVAV